MKKERSKTFYIFEKAIGEEAQPRLVEMVVGTVAEARDVIRSDAYADGIWLVLEDTSGDIVKTTTKSTTIVFEPPAARKRTRKAKEA